MVTIIRHRITYLVNSSYLLILPFTLSNNIILRSVLSIPCILSMSDVVDLVQGKIVCLGFNQVFMLRLVSRGNGLPDGVYYGTSFYCTWPLSSPIQYTASIETITSVSQDTYFGNLVVTHNFSKAVSRVSWYDLILILFLGVSLTINKNWTKLLLLTSWPKTTLVVLFY